MKTNLVGFLALSAIALSCSQIWSQGTFQYDQQSSDESLPGAGGFFLAGAQPCGQSFTPQLSGVGFVRLRLSDPIPSDSAGATLRVNLRSGSVSGSLLAASEAVSLHDGFGLGGQPGYVDFRFPVEVVVTPGTTYYFQPVLESGNDWFVAAYHFGYPGGTLFIQGAPAGYDLWFRSGIIVPEPGTGAVLGLGLALLALTRRPRT